ncbi:PQQ-binding-like beta-propeller repeat protein [Streptomyces sp. NPDC048650]|uniref:outer membrane protein assembly factor BamB family protein n=1 Tax=unclassified Streptomyces TaxID=2593676 RepID=UPI0037115F88
MTDTGTPGAAGPPPGQPQNPPPAPGAMSWQKGAQQQQPPQPPLQQQQAPQYPQAPQHQQVPQQPQQGYGYPQQAPAPPQGYAPAPPVQQAYGNQQPPPPPGPQAPYPSQAQAPYGAPAAPPAKKGKAGLIVLLVVALVVLGGAGTGAWFLLSGSSADEAVLWSQPSYEGKLPPGEMAAEVQGTWFAGKTVVQTLPDGVKAYNVDSGKRVWASPLPGDTNTACAAPPGSDGGIGLVAYGDAKACDHLVAFDLSNGKQLWTKKFSKPKAKPKDPDKLFDPDAGGPPDTSGGSFVRSGDVVITSVWGVTRALKVSDGSPAWTPGRTGKCDGTGSYTGGKALIRVRTCDTKPLGGVAYDEVSKIDVATGKPKWTYTFHPEKGEFDAGMAVGGKVISTDPVVLYPGRTDMGLMALDSETGKLRSTFSPKEPAKYVQSHDPEGAPWTQAGAFGNTFVIAVSEGNPGNLLVAYDLDSGKLLWKTKVAQYTDYFPLPGANGDKLDVFVRNNDPDKGPELVEYDPKSGKPHTAVEYPDEVDEGLDSSARPYWRDGRLYMTAIGKEVMMESKSYSIIGLKLKQ